MSIVKDVRINEAEYELKNGEKGKLAIFFYSVLEILQKF